MGLADILRRFGPAYLATHDLPAAKAKVWRAIVACRTAALGGHVEACDACGSTRHVYHSCRNRHCPLCQTRAKEAWLAARRRELLPVPYFHLVFTLPHDLNRLIGQRPRAIYELLFGAVSATLTEFAANPRWLGGTPAFSLVLHTWKQDLGRHVHVHALVAGGALLATGEWAKAASGFLFPVKALSKVFRGKFVEALNGERATKLSDEAELADGPGDGEHDSVGQTPPDRREGDAPKRLPSSGAERRGRLLLVVADLAQHRGDLADDEREAHEHGGEHDPRQGEQNLDAD